MLYFVDVSFYELSSNIYWLKLSDYIPYTILLKIDNCQKVKHLEPVKQRLYHLNI